MTVPSTTPTFAAFAASTTPASNSSSGASSLTGAGGDVSESMFLQLLVAQMKNQDPTTPSDPTQFVGELAQFSQLEQTIQIRSDADSINTTLTAAGAGTGTPSANGSTGN